MLGVLGVTRPDANSAEVGFGNLLQFSGCFTWAAYTLLGARAVRSSGALRVTTWNTLIAAALLSLYAFWSGFGHDLGGAQIAALLYLGLVSSAAAFLAWYHSQNVHGSQRTAATLYVEPFVTVLVSAWALGEPLVASTLVGGLVVLPGVWLVQRGSQPTKASA
jgi:drug/metabolite transporter (DMT)-like permease